jgi:hypothetical protein
LNSQILYTSRKPKPQPTPAPAKALAPAPDRITIDWGQHGRLHLPRSKAPESDRQQQAHREESKGTRDRSVMSAESWPVPVETPRGRAGQIDRYSKLEGIGRQKPLWEELAEQKSGLRALEYLAVLKVGDREYVITERKTGEIFVDQTFETRQHCYDAAVDMERTFDMAQVLELKLPETMERIDELVEWHWLKEWVALGLG